MALTGRFWEAGATAMPSRSEVPAKSILRKARVLVIADVEDDDERVGHRNNDDQIPNALRFQTSAAQRSPLVAVR